MNSIYTWEDMKKDSRRALQTFAVRRFLRLNAKKHYECIIKSHTDAPDFEVSCEARSRDEAIRTFTDMLNRYGEDSWDYATVAQYVSDGE